MYQIKTTDFLLSTNINNDLMNISIIRASADDSFITTHHFLYAIYSGNYKLEFSFDKNEKFHYLLIEESSLEINKNNSLIEYFDDASIFGVNRQAILERYPVHLAKTDNSIRIGFLELYFSEEKVESLYFFGLQESQP